MTYDSVHHYASPAYGTIFAGHFNEADRYVTNRPEGMADWLLVYTLEGEGYFRTPSGETRCTAGDVCLLRGGVPHQYGTAPECRWNLIWSHFPYLTETKYVPDADLLRISLGDEHSRNRVYRALRNVLQDSRERRSLWEQLCENEIRGVLLLMAEQSRKKADPRVEETLHYLSRHMGDTLRVEEIARAIGLSASRLSHLFKQETGSTLMDTLNEMRIRQAALLMKLSGRTATEAATDVGFRNYNHFASVFRRQMGVNPGEYRRLHHPASFFHA
ncbi:helix-turn-helix domain-containing protein [Cohnella nanjingensis]|uniref:helix-turn-helix domain-containing protein n=1 Tax=Cohnella nanjingensis TaxID=1387779 RepID=UPI0028AA7DA1|nr:helix-turn-helix domain-containing protein [Cohnella nanjingensis]